MSTQSVIKSVALPHEGEQVEFVLEGREVPMVGTYAQQTFRSRWSDYDVARVRTWRSAGAHFDAATSAHQQGA